MTCYSHFKNENCSRNIKHHHFCCFILGATSHGHLQLADLFTLLSIIFSYRVYQIVMERTQHFPWIYLPSKSDIWHIPFSFYRLCWPPVFAYVLLLSSSQSLDLYKIEVFFLKVQ